MPAIHANWTVAQLDALPEDLRRHEIIDGVLHVTPAPSEVHLLVAGAFYRRVYEHLRPGGVALALCSPADVRTGDTARNRVQPDVFAVRLVDGRRPPYPYSLHDLVLAIEVQSPGNPLLDYQVKRQLYLSSGVPEYWVVNPEARNVSRWRGRDDPGEVLSARLEWMPSGMTTALAVDLPALFAEALD
jgi:Uma2 family endonuclease